MRIDTLYNRSLISPGDPGRSHSVTCFDTGESFSELLVIIYGAGEAPFSDTKQQTSVSVRLLWDHRALGFTRERKSRQKLYIKCKNTQLLFDRKMAIYWLTCATDGRLGIWWWLWRWGKDVLSAAGWRFRPQRLLLFLLGCVEAIFMAAVTSQRQSVWALRGGSNKMFFLSSSPSIFLPPPPRDDQGMAVHRPFTGRRNTSFYPVDMISWWGFGVTLLGL